MKKILGIILIVIVALGVWYMFLGGREYIETGLLGQDAVAVEIKTTHTAVESSPLKDVTVDVQVKAYKTRVQRNLNLKLGPTEKEYRYKEISEDKMPDYVTQVNFTKTIAIYNATGDLIFQRTMTFTKGTDKIITIYGTVEELKPGTTIKIVITIYIKIDLPAQAGMVMPPIEKTIGPLERTTTVEG
jgi:uncharacterized protein YxeA